MRYLFLSILISVSFLACKKEINNKNTKKATKTDIKIQKKDTDSDLVFSKPKDLIIIGKFFKPTKIDTLQLKYYSKNSKKYINSLPLPFDNDFNTCIQYFLKNEISLHLGSKFNYLEFNNAFGLYFLKNLGDTNKDGLDEIAVVIDYTDYSNLNSCKVYQICKNSWEILFHFNVNENTFLSENECRIIKKEGDFFDFIKFKNHKWYYADYDETMNSDNAQPNFKKLKIQKCK